MKAHDVVLTFERNIDRSRFATTAYLLTQMYDAVTEKLFADYRLVDVFYRPAEVNNRDHIPDWAKDIEKGAK